MGSLARALSIICANLDALIVNHTLINNLLRGLSQAITKRKRFCAVILIDHDRFPKIDSSIVRQVYSYSIKREMSWLLAMEETDAYKTKQL